MRSLREIAGGIIFALISIGLIIGSLSLAFSENSLNASPSATHQPSSTITIILPSQTAPATTLPAPAQQVTTFTPIAISPTSALALPAAPANTPWPTVTNCVPRADWTQIYTVRAGDNLYRIGLLYRITVAQLQRANCLTTTVIYTNQKLRVPNVPTSTSTASPTSLPSATPTNTATPSPTATASSTALPTDTSIPSSTPTFTPFPRTATPTPTQ